MERGGVGVGELGGGWGRAQGVVQGGRGEGLLVWPGLLPLIGKFPRF